MTPAELQRVSDTIDRITLSEHNAKISIVNAEEGRVLYADPPWSYNDKGDIVSLTLWTRAHPVHTEGHLRYNRAVMLATMTITAYDVARSQGFMAGHTPLTGASGRQRGGPYDSSFGAVSLPLPGTWSSSQRRPDNKLETHRDLA